VISRAHLLAALATVACGSLLAVACIPEPEVGGVLAGHCSSEDSDPDHDVSFSVDVRALFDRPAAMAGCGCHSAGGSGLSLSGFDMSSLASIRRGGAISGRNIIVPGDPCASVLVQKVSAAPATGARMPLSGPPFFSAAEIQLVADWIAEGAKDN
jgi:hypothetical protein